MKEKLRPLREQIDSIDEQLFELISKRLSLVEQIGMIKGELQAPIYDPKREEAIIAKRCQQAKARGLSLTLVEDILRRLMRESYIMQMNKQAVRTSGVPKVVVIGGRGSLGQLMVRLFTHAGCQVEILDKDDWQQAEQIITGAQMVLVSVPIHITCAVIKKVTRFMNEQMILADVTSIKRAPMQAMLNYHKGAVLGLHPMFGGDSAHLVKQVIVACHGRFSERYQWVLDLFADLGANIVSIKAQEHDDVMIYLQALRHFTTFAFAHYLSSQSFSVSQLLTLSSPIYRLELAMCGRLFAQKGGLYFDIMSENDHSVQAIASLVNAFAKSSQIIQDRDRSTFLCEFDKVSQWFGSYAQEFLHKSGHLLQFSEDFR